MRCQADSFAAHLSGGPVMMPMFSHFRIMQTLVTECLSALPETAPHGMFHADRGLSGKTSVISSQKADNSGRALRQFKDLHP
jgi:hypothetical protein